MANHLRHHSYNLVTWKRGRVEVREVGEQSLEEESEDGEIETDDEETGTDDGGPNGDEREDSFFISRD